MKNVIAGLVAAFVVPGCASIISTANYPVSIDSRPSNMGVVVTNSSGREVHRAVTPTTVTLNSKGGFFRAEQYVVTVMQGDDVVGSTSVGTSVNGWYFANLLFGGVIGMLIVDPATGAMWRLEPEVTVTANVGNASMDNAERILHVVDINDLSEAERRRLVALR